MATDTDKNASSGSPEVETPKVSSKDLGIAAWTCSLGSALEYYDFALYSLASALIFGPLFFPHQAPGCFPDRQFCYLLYRFRGTPLRRHHLRCVGRSIRPKICSVNNRSFDGACQKENPLLPHFALNRSRQSGIESGALHNLIESIRPQ